MRVRFAPSPTGDLHLGSALAALANRSYADGSGGSFVLRIDDTDRERSTAAAVESIQADLRWLEIRWDDGPYFQAVRSDVHAALLARLDEVGATYACFCTDERLESLREAQRAAGLPPRYDGKCRALDPSDVERRRNLGDRPAIRLRVPAETDYDVVDLVHGPVPGPAGSFGDFVLQRSDGTFTYLFASVCDDVDLAVTHVIRGEDHLANTARQLAIFDALDEQPPAFAHLPLLRGADGRKLAKRDPLGSIGQLRSAGYRASTIRSYLGELLGQGNGADPLRVPFDLAKIPAGGAPVVDAHRLDSLGRDTFAAMNRDQVMGVLIETGLELDPQWEPLVLEVAPGCATSRELVAAIEQVSTPPEHREVVAGVDALREQVEADGGVLPSVEELATLIESTAATASDAAALLAAWKAALPVRAGTAMRLLRMLLTGQNGGPPLPLIITVLGMQQVVQRAGAMRIGAGAGNNG